MFYFYESPYKDRSTRVCVVRERVNNLDQDISWSNHFCPKPLDLPVALDTPIKP